MLGIIIQPGWCIDALNLTKVAWTCPSARAILTAFSADITDLLQSEHNVDRRPS